MRFRGLAGVLLAALLLAACDDWQRTNVEPVQATIVKKTSRRSGKVPRRYFVVIEYQGHRAEMRDSSAYRSKNVGDAYPACLVTYVEATRKETRIQLQYCPS